MVQSRWLSLTDKQRQPYYDEARTKVYVGLEKTDPVKEQQLRELAVELFWIAALRK